MAMFDIFNQQYPELCVVCTSLPLSEFATETEAAGSLATRWLLDNRDILVGTLLGLKEPERIREVVAVWENAGFSTQLLCEVAPEELQSEALEERARGYLALTNRVPADYRAVRLGFQDVYKKTPLLIFYWFFKNPHRDEVGPTTS